MKKYLWVVAALLLVAFSCIACSEKEAEEEKSETIKCETHDDCPTGYECIIAQKICARYLEPYTCQGDEDCAPGYTCLIHERTIYNKCIPEDGDTPDEPFQGSRLLELTDCEGFFGKPGANTGMSEDACGPVCTCADGVFEPDYDEAFVASLREWELLNPPAELTEDPYAHPDQYPRRDEAFCAVMVADREVKSYTLQTFDTLDELEAAGGILTHTSACGACSSLASLALLIEMPDQTGPIRNCGLRGLGGDLEAVLQCLEDLGFERPCAQVNAYNTAHTAEACGKVCLSLLGAPYQSEDGQLNECIQCDEDASGDIFRAAAGRARRNAGIPAALCRPCDTMTYIIHRYE